MSANGVLEIEVRAVLPTSGGCAVFLGNQEKVFVIYVDQTVGAAITMFMRSTPKLVRLQEIVPVPSIDPVPINAASEQTSAGARNSQASIVTLGGVDIASRLQEVAEALMESPACAGRVTLSQAMIGDSLVRPDCVGPIVSIVNEALTNAIKYAHPAGVPGKISVDCRRERDAACTRPCRCMNIASSSSACTSASCGTWANSPAISADRTATAFC